jgi:steroid 5-alpha reductase family enzyme
MHGQSETTSAPRNICTFIHILFVGIAAWIFFGGGLEYINSWISDVHTSPGHLARQIILFAFSVLLLLRMSFELYYLLKRKFDWSELGGVLFALFLYQVLYALLGGNNEKTIDGIDVFAVTLFLLGSLINTISEVQRKRFKDKPENRGILYTQGLFQYARHINYFGDVLWVTGWAIVTRNVFSAIIPVCITALFVFFFIPSLSNHLKSKYGQQYEVWKGSTKSLVPFIF